MTALKRFASMFSILLIMHCGVLGAELSEKQISKLHPFFQTVIAKSLPQVLESAGSWSGPEPSRTSDGTLLYNAIIYTRDAEAIRSIGIHLNSVLPEFVTAQLTPTEMIKLLDIESVRYLDPGSINYPQLEVSVPEIGASLLHTGFIDSTSYRGSGAIVLIYDTGIDWKHLDFRKADTTKSRILCIWDQTLSAGGGESPPSGFAYGVEYTQAHIENELDGSPAGFVREMDINGHGTHVASTAAGNGLSLDTKYIGVAPEADIIVIKGGNQSFGETQMIDGLTYAGNKAVAFGKPIVVNWSIGGHDGPHDGQRAYEIAVDNFVQNPGRAVCISAGNDGDNPIHISGAVSSGSPFDIMLDVPSYTPKDGLNNDIFTVTVWLPDAQAMDVTVTSPGGTVVYTRTAGQSGTAPSKVHGTIDVWNTISTLNSHRNIKVYVHDADANIPASGSWMISLSMSSGSSTIDGWLASSSLGTTSANLPGGNTSKTVSMPATSNYAITVGSYVTKGVWPAYNGGTWTYNSTEGDISDFSSIGPTSDGRLKPDIAAPGEVIGAALSSDVDTTYMHYYILKGNKHWVMQGTSMAAPHVTGGAALLLGANPSLTGVQIQSLFTSTANSDPYASPLPSYTWGNGKFDVLEAMAKSIYSGATVERTTFAYDGTGASSYMRLTGNQKYAVRFSPTVSGTLTGIQVNITSQNNKPIGGTGPLVCEAYTNSGGYPGTKIGSTVYHPLSLLTPSTNNYIQFTNANVNVTAGTDYHIVLSNTNPTDTVIIRLENVTSGSRSSVFNGSWSGQSFNFRIRSIVTTTSGLTGVDDGTSYLHPLAYRLNQNYPNPFNPSTIIEYSIPVKGMVKLQVYDILGRLIATLVDAVQDAGAYNVKWSGKTENAATLPSGVYFYRLQSGSFTKTERMLLLK